MVFFRRRRRQRNAASLTAISRHPGSRPVQPLAEPALVQEHLLQGMQLAVEKVVRLVNQADPRVRAAVSAGAVSI